MARLVIEPSVTLIAMSCMLPGQFDAWASEHGLEEAMYGETPLGNIRARINEESLNDMDILPEFAGRFCYRSWTKGRDPDEYIKNILESGHGSVLEHSYASYAISGVSRTLTHELVRHRAGTGISQESQRFVDAKDIRFVVPPIVDLLPDEYRYMFLDNMDAECNNALAAYKRYQDILEHVPGLGDMKRKRINEAARHCLPGCTETRLVWTMNLRAARHIFNMRGSEHADLEIRRLAVHMFRETQAIAPLALQDVEEGLGPDNLLKLNLDHPKV